MNMISGVWYLWYLLFLPVNGYFFTNPPPQSDNTLNTVYAIGSDFDIQWASYNGESNFLELLMWQVGTGKYATIFPNTSGLWQYPWTITPDSSQNLSISNQFYFNLYIAGDDETIIAESHNFNLTDSVTTTSTTTSMTLLPSTITSTITITPSATDNARSSSELSTGAKAGIGVGIPVAAIVGFGAGIIFARWNRRKKNTAESIQQQSMQNLESYQYQPSYAQVPRGEPEYGISSLFEMPASPEPVVGYK